MTKFWFKYYRTLCFIFPENGFNFARQKFAFRPIFYRHSGCLNGAEECSSWRKRKCRNFEPSYKVLSQQELLNFLITFSLLSNKFCFFLKYYHFSRCCNISYLFLTFRSGNQKQQKLLKNAFDTTATCWENRGHNRSVLRTLRIINDRVFSWKSLTVFT